VIPDRSRTVARSIKTFSLVNNEADIETSLKELFKTPRNRSIEVVSKRAQEINDGFWRLRYINIAKQMLDEFELVAKGKK
jgi:hypothetical protein